MDRIDGIDIFSGNAISVSIVDELINSIESIPASETLPFLAPGIVDLQVNGFRGIDFNDEELSIDDIQLIVQQLFAEGVTSFLPTIITNSEAFICKQLHKIVEACHHFPVVKQAIAGIHLEGPFISPLDGPRGAHDKQFVVAPDTTMLDRFADAAEGLLKMLTFSPEWEEAPSLVRHCLQKDIIASIGHTAADSIAINRAVEAGASMSTHLGNATHAVLPRHPNYIWDQLAEERLAAGFIADGFHLPDAVLKTIIRMKGSNAILVSDSVALAGCAPGAYTTPVGGNVVLTNEGRLYLADTPQALAGSAQTILQGVGNLVNKNICGLAEAWRMASTYPSRKINLPQAEGITIGAPADLVLISSDNKLLATYKNGRQVA